MDIGSDFGRIGAMDISENGVIGVGYQESSFLRFYKFQGEESKGGWVYRRGRRGYMVIGIGEEGLGILFGEKVKRLDLMGRAEAATEAVTEAASEGMDGGMEGGMDRGMKSKGKEYDFKNKGLRLKGLGLGKMWEDVWFESRGVRN